MDLLYVTVVIQLIISLYLLVIVQKIQNDKNNDRAVIGWIIKQTGLDNELNIVP